MIGVDAVHLMALHEQQEMDTEAASTQLNRVHYGFAFLDAAAGRFYVGSASDDASRANLGALLTQVNPVRLHQTRIPLPAGAQVQSVAPWLVVHVGTQVAL